MHLQDPYVTSPADHLGRVIVTIDDRDGTEPNLEIRADIRLMDDAGHQVADRVGTPHYMPADWQARAMALIQEFRAATAEIQGLAAAPPDPSA